MYIHEDVKGHHVYEEMWTPACCEVLEDFETFIISGSFGNSAQLAR